MKKAVSEALLGRTFRASGHFELVLFERLSPREQALFAELQRDPDFYGILRPRGGGRTIKAVDRETALLLLTLREPGPLPGFVPRQAGTAAAKRLAELVLDGILEVQDGERFVSGGEAMPLLGAAGAEAAPEGALARRSLEALRYAAALELDEPRQIASRLYTYNRVPLSPAWLRRFPDAEAVLDYVGAGGGGVLAKGLAARWAGPESRASEWLSWSRRNGPSLSGDGPVYKLYVSPTVEALPRAMEGLVEVLAGLRVNGFKLGAGAAGLLRPDKLVAYFARFEDLAAAAERLAERLADLAVHGVPFTAEVAGDGLLSWGLDPPRAEQALSWQGPESWRLWVCHRLAVALLEGKRAPGAGTTPWHFALERLRLEGVDVDRWTPSLSLFQRALAGDA